MFPDRQDLLDKLPDPMKLALAQLVKHGWLMNDMCNTALKLWKLLRKVIKSEEQENGMTQDEINVYEADYWYDLHNVWIGGVVLELDQNQA